MTNTTTPDVMFSIILPVYNQAPYIADIIHSYQKELKNLPARCEFLLVVNGDKDASLDICQKLSRQYENIRVFHSAKKGWGIAVRLGFKEARGNLICYTNSARTTAKDLLLFLLYAFANPETVVKANRKIRENWVRRLGSLLYNLQCRALFGLAYWDINGTPKVFPRKFDLLLHLSKNDNLIDLEFNYVCQKNHYPVIEVPVLSYKRQGGKSTTGYFSAVEMYCKAFQFWAAIKQNLKDEKSS